MKSHFASIQSNSLSIPNQDHSNQYSTKFSLIDCIRALLDCEERVARGAGEGPMNSEWIIWSKHKRRVFGQSHGWPCPEYNMEVGTLLELETSKLLFQQNL